MDTNIAAIAMVKARDLQRQADALSTLLKSGHMPEQADAMLNVSAALESAMDALDKVPGINDGHTAMREMLSPEREQERQDKIKMAQRHMPLCPKTEVRS